VKPEHAIESILRKRFPRIHVLASTQGPSYERLLIGKEHLIDAMQFLQQDPDTQFDMLVDISAIHHIQSTERFFEVFYLVRSTRLRYQLGVSVNVLEVMASLPTITPIYAGANWLERELWDMFGVFVEGHPDLKRLLLFEEFNGHPLRKDYEEPLQS